MLLALEYLRPVGRGVTSPQLIRADDGKVYVVKMQNNRLGPMILANELLGAKLGEKLGLCFPPGGVVKISEQFLRSNTFLAGRGVKPGRHFACQFLSGTSYLTRYNLLKAVNKAEMAGVMLFDNLFFNYDRALNRRNLLLRREHEGYRIYAIDNSHLFRRGLWTKEWLDKLAPQIRINRYRSYGTLMRQFMEIDSFDGYLRKVEALSDSILEEIIDGIPNEWLPHTDDRQALRRFLAVRRDMASDVATCMRALIPDKHRRADHDIRE